MLRAIEYFLWGSEWHWCVSLTSWSAIYSGWCVLFQVATAHVYVSVTKENPRGFGMIKRGFKQTQQECDIASKHEDMPSNTLKVILLFHS